MRENVRSLARLIESHRFDLTDEARLQEGIAELLTSSEFDFEREVRLSKSDRIDFIVDTVGIEVKIDHPLSALTRQLHRYAQHKRIEGLLLVTTRTRLARVPETINGKPLGVAVILGAFA